MLSDERQLAEEMLFELENSHFEVVLVPAPEPRHSMHHFMTISGINLTGIVNEELCKNANVEDLLRLGFTQIDDGSGDSRGLSYEFETAGFRVWLDCVFVVHLSRKNPDSDSIKVIVDTLHDLECLLDWIAD